MGTKFVESYFDICLINLIFIPHRNPINFIVIRYDSDINVLSVKFSFQIGASKFSSFRMLESFCLEFPYHFGFTPIDGNP